MFRVAIGLCILLTACGGDGGSSGGGGGGGTDALGVACQFMSGGSVVGTTAGTSGTIIQNGAAAADGDLRTFAAVIANGGTTTVASIRANSPTVFPAGSNVGVFLTPSRGTTFNTTMLNTYLGGTPQETGIGPLTTFESTQGRTPAAFLTSFETTMDFDSAEILVSENSTGAGVVSYEIYEICGDARVE